MKHTKDLILIFSDAELTYKVFSEHKNATHIVIKSNEKENKKLQKIDSLRSRLKSFLSPFKGVSNIYVKFYLKWFHFLEKTKHYNNKNQTHKLWNLLLGFTFHRIS